MLIVLTGPGSVGKDAVVLRLLAKYPKLKKVVTTTSRSPRAWEKQGEDYYFLKKEDFENKVKKGEFLEYVLFAGNYYGTTKEALQPLIEGEDMVWRVEITRGANIEKLFAENFPNMSDSLIRKTKVIYLDVPDWDILRERLKKRGLGEYEIEKRLTADKKDWEKYKNRFKNIVTNIPGKLDETVEKITSLLNL